MKEDFLQLILVTNKGIADTNSYLEFVKICIKGGITCVQLREKSLSNKELFDFGTVLKRLLDLHDLPLIVNDHVDLCIELDAKGVHLGQSDTQYAKARETLGVYKIIGLSVNTLQQIEQVKLQLPDYIGIGAIFPTNNKPNVETIWGLDGLKQAATLALCPIVAIGGIDERNALSVMLSGANGLAAIGAFHNAIDPFRTSQNLRRIITEVNNDR